MAREGGYWTSQISLGSRMKQPGTHVYVGPPSCVCGNGEEQRRDGEWLELGCVEGKVDVVVEDGGLKPLTYLERAELSGRRGMEIV